MKDLDTWWMMVGLGGVKEAKKSSGLSSEDA